MDKLPEIPDVIASAFDTIAGRREMYEKYAYSGCLFVGRNAEGEQVHVSLYPEQGIVCKTYQNNGWICVVKYDTNGMMVEESYEGRWTEDL